MSNYLRLAGDAGDQYLAAVADSQEYFLKSVSSLAWPANGAAVPGYSADMSTTLELTSASFAFAEKLVQQQRDFVQKLVAVTSSGHLPSKDTESEPAAASVVPTKDSKTEPITKRPATHEHAQGSHRPSRRAAGEQIAVAKRPTAQPATRAPKKRRKGAR